MGSPSLSDTTDSQSSRYFTRPCRIVLVGRPNVGKSTLFNRLAGRPLSVVYDQPGVTRDWKECRVILGNRNFVLVDTPGLEIDQAREADKIVFVCDARDGVLSEDENLFRRMLKHAGKTPVVVVLNKAEKLMQGGLIDSSVHTLRGGGTREEPVLVSALHGVGMEDLVEDLLQTESKGVGVSVNRGTDGDVSEREPNSRVVIIGQPNSGKSTLMNSLIGRERVKVGPQAGLTRDAVDAIAQVGSCRIVLCDTPGLRRRAKVEDELDLLSWKEAIRAVRFAHVAILLIDATCPFEKQDLRIARHVIDEGRSIMIALNKWDLIGNKRSALRRFQKDMEEHLPQCRSIPVLPVSALKGWGLEALAPRLILTLEAWNKRLRTSELNRWLESAVRHHLPPRLPGGKVLTIKYVTQTKSRPPTFIAFTNVRGSKLGECERAIRAYGRYLTNSLCNAFKLFGSPVRLSFRHRLEKDGRGNGKKILTNRKV